MTPNRAKQARAMYDAGQHTVQEIADTCRVSRPTIYRHLGAATASPDRRREQPGRSLLYDAVAAAMLLTVASRTGGGVHRMVVLLLVATAAKGQYDA